MSNPSDRPALSPRRLLVRDHGPAARRGKPKPRPKPFSARTLIVVGVSVVLFVAGTIGIVCTSGHSPGARSPDEVAGVATSAAKREPIVNPDPRAGALPSSARVSQDNAIVSPVTTATTQTTANRVVSEPTMSLDGKPAALSATLPSAPPPSSSVAATFVESCTGTYGTSIKFVSNPVDGAAAAVREQKLQFTLHISGNFEESRFT